MGGAKPHNGHIRGLTGWIGSVNRNTGHRVAIRIDVLSSFDESPGTAGSIRSDEYAATGRKPRSEAFERTKSVRTGIDHVGEATRILWPARSQSTNLIDLATCTNA